MVSSRTASSSRESTVTEAADWSELNKAAAKATRTSLTAIKSAFVRRDFCERARAAAQMSANSLQSAAMCARIELLSGGVRKLPLASAMPNCVEEFHSAKEPRNKRRAQVASTGLFRLPDAELGDLLPQGVAHFCAGAWPRAEIDLGQVLGHRDQVTHPHSRRRVEKRNQSVLP
jgi:hypothetical protein